MPEIIPPLRLDLLGATVVFLAGSIEMGRAHPWQAQAAGQLLAAFPNLVVANPRRANWDPSWSQSISNPVFKDQVNWELDHLARADLALFYFQPDTMSPITLMELGHRLGSHPHPSSTMVCCPPGFWRRGNIEVMMDRYQLGHPFTDLDAMVEAAIEKLKTIPVLRPANNGGEVP